MHKARWIVKLHRESGLLPVLSVQCVVETAAEAKRVEVALIALYKKRGARLTNGTAGGDGVVDPTPEAREKHASAIRGKPRHFTPEHREALSKARRQLVASGWIFSQSEEAKRRIGFAAKGRPGPKLKGEANPFFGKHHSSEVIERMSKARRGKNLGPLSAEHRAKLSEAARRRPSMDVETRAKISATLTGRKSGPLSEEHREKIRRSWVRRRIKNVAQTHPTSVASMLTMSRLLSERVEHKGA